MPELPPDDTADPSRTVTDDFLQEEYHVSAAEAGEFLIDLGERLRTGEEVVLTSADWDLPFAYREPVELEIEYAGGADPELEIEIELSGRGDQGSPPSLG